jgi:hypothetical protein
MKRVEEDERLLGGCCLLYWGLFWVALTLYRRVSDGSRILDSDFVCVIAILVNLKARTMVSAISLV